MTIFILKLSDTTDQSLAAIKANLINTYSVADIQVVSAEDVRRAGLVKGTKMLFGMHGDLLVIASENLRERRRLYIFKSIGLLVRTKKRIITDPDQNIIRFGWPIFIFHDLPLIVLDILASLMMAIFWLFIFPILWLVIRPVKITPSQSEKLKVVFFRTDYYVGRQTGGSFSHIRGFVDGLLVSGHSVRFIASVMPTELDEKVTPLRIIPYPKFFDFFPEAAEMAYNFKLVFGALPDLKRNRPDFLYHRHSGFHVGTAVLSYLTGIPLMLEVNNSEYWLRTKWDSVGFRLWLKYFEKIAWRGANKIFVVSEVLKNDLVKWGVPEEKVVANPNGVDPAKFNPEISGDKIRKQFGFLKDEVVVGFLGTFGVWHGVPVLAKAIPKILGENKKIKFLIIGEGALKSEVERDLERAGVRGQVELPGLVPHSVVPEWLAACDILASPHVPNQDGTRFFGSPTKLFEYMAMGKAIVASNLEQLGQVLKNDQTAILVKPGDEKALAEAILIAAGDPKLRKRLGEAAYREAIEQHTWQRNAERVVESYRNVTP